MSTSLQFIATFLFFSVLGCHSNSQETSQSNGAEMAEPSVPENGVGLVEIPSRITKLTQPEINNLDSLNIKFLFRGNCYAYSSEKNAIPHNGESHSDNLAKEVDQNFPRNGFYLVINQNEFVSIDDKTLGCKLYVVNTSDSLISLRASDSRLNIVAEAFYNEQWVPISYLPSSSCGNSYHTVILDKDEFWEFSVPIFTGEIKTKMRYTLTVSKEKKISSNEVVVYLNREQFDPKNLQGYSSTNLMDPYSE